VTTTHTDAARHPRPALEVRGVSKTFRGQRALVDLDLTLRRGEVHALLGHNGSGKSTLIKILAGIHEPDPGGSILVGDEPLPLAAPKQSYRLGLRFVHQRLAVVGQMSAADNLALGRAYPRRFGLFIDWRRQRAEAARTLRLLDDAEAADPTTPLGDEAAITRARLAIGRALADLSDDGILVLDEPTASLSPTETEHLFRSLARVRERGIAILYVTHRLREVYRLADRITLLRDGRSLGTHDVAALPVERLIEILAEGSTASAATERAARRGAAAASVSAPASADALVVEGLSSAGLDDISLRIGAGEIVGVCGLDGSGREVLGRALVGAVSARARRVATPRGETAEVDVSTLARLGVVLARESRATGALVDPFTMRENLSLPFLGRFARRGWVDRRAEERFAREWIERIDVRPADPEKVVAEMSGGNRQKVVIGRALSREPVVVVLDDPTAGVDVGASAMLHELFRALAAAGQGVLLISSDFEELVDLCDRVLVLRGGAIGGELTGEQITEAALLGALE
jgi:ribose transport system ATP-binding protein